jgi:hypothetical protein
LTEKPVFLFMPPVLVESAKFDKVLRNDLFCVSTSRTLLI